MSIQSIAVAALAASALSYLWLGIRLLRRTRTLEDLLPISRNGEAKVRNAVEFSSSTVAATISLATVVLAFVDLAPVFGLWLLWTAITTALGLVVMRIAAPFIWDKVNSNSLERYTLHSYLGVAFNSSVLVRSAAFCTTFGFLGALATELTVGSRFLASMVPSANETVVTLVLAAVGIIYTLTGGFRVVIQTDRVQMIVIWFAICALATLIILQLYGDASISNFFANTPKGLFDLSWRDGLGSFLVGIFVINVPSFLGDMSVWQRIAGTRTEFDLEKGLIRSVIGAALSWSLLAIIACFVVGLTASANDTNPLSQFLKNAAANGSTLVIILAFVTIVGLYAASLSSASTQLIASGQAVKVDVLRAGRVGEVFSTSRLELINARVWVLVLGSVSVALVETLRSAGFTIADLVFSIYGAQLGLTPAVVLGLIGNRAANLSRGSIVAVAILMGFAACWFSSVFGKISGDDNLVFLSPLVSLAVSTVVCLLSLFVRGHQAR